MLREYTVSRDDTIYEAFPTLALTPSGRLVCVFSECAHHRDRSYTRLVYCTSEDRGRTWSGKRALSEALRGDPKVDPFWDCAGITALGDGRLVVVASRVANRDEQSNWLWWSEDKGETWDGPRETPICGLVPDRLLELDSGRWIIATHTALGTPQEPVLTERCWLSDDQGITWSGPFTIAAQPGLKLCEGSILQLPGGELVCFLRENSGQGLDAYKAISHDGGLNWEGPYRMPIPACHRPVAGMLASGHVLITHRLMQGGKSLAGWWTQNLFAAYTDVASCLATSRAEAYVRIMPIAYDRSPESDTGYSGWIQFPDGEIYVVNYALDDAPKGQIRGYSFYESDIVLAQP